MIKLIINENKIQPAKRHIVNKIRINEAEQKYNSAVTSINKTSSFIF